MGLEEYMTEEELRELNLGRLAGGVARGVGAVAGGAAGAWDAAKQGYARGRDAVANYASQDDQDDTGSDYRQGFDLARASTSGDTSGLVDRAVELINKMSPADRQAVISKLKVKPGMAGRAAGTSSTGGSITPTNTGLIHKARPKPAAKASPTADQMSLAPKTGESKPRQPFLDPAASPLKKLQPKPAAKTAGKKTAVKEALRASPEEIMLYREEIKSINEIIKMLNMIYNRAKAKDDTESMDIIKSRIAIKTRERTMLMQQLEQRLTSDAFNTLKEELAL